MKQRRGLDLVFKSHGGKRWILLDFLIGFFAMLIALNVSPYVDIWEPYNRIIVSFFYGITLVTTLRLCGLNTRHMEHLLTKYEVLLGSLQGCFFAFILIAVVVNFTHVHVFGRYVVVITLFLSFLGSAGFRALCKWYLKANPIKVAFIGCNELALELRQRIAHNTHFKIICVASDKPCEIKQLADRYEQYLIEDPAQFVEYLKEKQTDFAISFYRDELPEKIKEVLKTLPFSGMDVINKGAFIELFFREVSLSYRNLHWHTGEFFLPERGTIAMLKRVIDFTVALIAILLLAPFIPLIALLIKLDSPGPAIFKQVRLGFLGKPFTLYKFRTMRNDAEKNGAQWATQNDPRVTRMGHLMRRTRIDEIPQLWNVLKGEMSLVGPRPERPEFTEELEEAIPLYKWRCLMPPGLTGWAQIRYKYADSIDDTKRKLQFDLFYIKNFSLRLDIEILFRTIPLVMRGSR